MYPMSQYTIHKNGVNEGPFTLDEARAAMASGKFAATDLAWRPGIPQWIALANLLAADAGEPPPLPSVVPPAMPVATKSSSGTNVGIIVAILGVCALVGIVTIGLLAALAIPAFKKVRNNAIEKTMMNDARQISSAYQSKCAEDAKEVVTVKEIRAYVPSLSSGVQFYSNPDPGGIVGLNYARGGADIIKLGRNGRFVLTHEHYNRLLSSQPMISGQTPGVDNGIVFDVETGSVVTSSEAP